MLVAPIVTIKIAITLVHRCIYAHILAKVFAHELGRIISTVGAHGRKLVRKVITIILAITLVVYIKTYIIAINTAYKLGRISSTVRAH